MPAKNSVRPEFSWLARRWRTVVALLGITAFQVVAALLSIQLLSSVRAFVAGESLYSTAQKDAQTFLSRYVEGRTEVNYEAFVAALAVPLGDRVAREELQHPEPDLDAARKGFLAGGNHPDDIPGLISTFRRFQSWPFMAKPIATWTEGDAIIEEMRDVASRARSRILAGDMGAPEVATLREQVPRLNERLTALTRRFSSELGEASRTTQRILLWLNLAIAAALVTAGLVFIRRSALTQELTEAEVVDRQRSLQRLLDSIVEGLYGTDLAGRCTFINRAALRMLGYEREADLLGCDMRGLMRSSGHSAAPTAMASPNGEQLFARRDGTTFPIECRSHPVLEDGRVQGAVVTFFDVTQRRQMQGALRRGEANIQRLVNSVTDGIVTIDADGRIMLFNAAAETMFKIQAGDAIGLTIGSFIDGGEAAIGLGGHRSALASEGVRELTCLRRDGGRFPAEASVSRLETDHELLTTIVMRDVSVSHAVLAERRAREALEAANKAKIDFLSRMSHELRTPLNAVIGFSQLLRADAHDVLSAAQQTRVHYIEVAGEHLLALVDDVLDLARIDAGKVGLLEDSISLSEVIDEATTMVSPQITKAGLQIFLPCWGNVGARHRVNTESVPSQTGQAEVWVRADRVRLRQILVNLLSNAIKYNRPGGQISLDVVVTEAGRCEVLIVDTGQGIAAERMDSLFQPFNRLGAEVSKVQGTGIGLVLSRQLAEMMGGSLTIESSFGTSTTACLELVLADALGQEAGTAVPPAAPAKEARHIDLMYAEDNEVNAELVRHLVAMRPNVSLRIAESGRAAFEMALDDPPDLMLVDMNLGDMTGMDLAHDLLSERTTRGIRLVALSADVLPEQIELALRSGFEHYMTKPIDYQAFLRFLDEW